MYEFLSSREFFPPVTVTVPWPAQSRCFPANSVGSSCLYGHIKLMYLNLPAKYEWWSFYKKKIPVTIYFTI